MAARPNIPAIRRWLWARARGAAALAARGCRAARREVGKKKYRAYLSDAYGRIRQRYPAVESRAREALDAIGVRRAGEEPAGKKPAARKAPARSKKAPKKKTGTGRRKTASKKAATAAKKTGTKKKAGAAKKKKKKTTR